MLELRDKRGIVAGYGVTKDTLDTIFSTSFPNSEKAMEAQQQIYNLAQKMVDDFTKRGYRAISDYAAKYGDGFKQKFVEAIEVDLGAFLVARFAGKEIPNPDGWRLTKDMVQTRVDDITFHKIGDTSRSVHVYSDHYIGDVAILSTTLADALQIPAEQKSEFVSWLLKDISSEVLAKENTLEQDVIQQAKNQLEVKPLDVRLKSCRKMSEKDIKKVCVLVDESVSILSGRYAEQYFGELSKEQMQLLRDEMRNRIGDALILTLTQHSVSLYDSDVHPRNVKHPKELKLPSDAHDKIRYISESIAKVSVEKWGKEALYNNQQYEEEEYGYVQSSEYGSRSYEIEQIVSFSSSYIRSSIIAGAEIAFSDMLPILSVSEHSVGDDVLSGNGAPTTSTGAFGAYRDNHSPSTHNVDNNVGSDDVGDDDIGEL